MCLTHPSLFFNTYQRTAARIVGAALQHHTRNTRYYEPPCDLITLTTVWDKSDDYGNGHCYNYGWGVMIHTMAGVRVAKEL